MEEYLFSDGRSIVGLNATLLNEWVDYNTQSVHDGWGCRYSKTTGSIKSTKWMDNWIEIDKFQSAL